MQAGNSTSVGGLVGYMSGTNAVLKRSVTVGNVAGSSNVGGLVGANGNASDFQPGGTIENATASGTVTLAGNSTDPEDLGGLVGQSYRGTVTQSNATGEVNGGNATNVGGLIGYNDATEPSTVRETYATGAVDGGQNVGGLVGKNVNDLVTNSYAMGAVNGTTPVGGLVGINTGSNATVNSSYAAGAVSGGSGGGLVGVSKNGATVQDAYWDTERTTQATSAGDAEGLTTSNMTGDNSLTTMSALNQSVWQTVTADTTGANGDGYPVLSTLALQPQILTIGSSDETVNTPSNPTSEESTNSPSSSRSQNDDDDDDRGRSRSGGGETSPTPETGETSVSLTTADDATGTPEAETSSEPETGGETPTQEEPQGSEENGDSADSRPSPDVSVSVTNPQPGQTLVIKGQAVQILEEGEKMGETPSSETPSSETPSSETPSPPATTPEDQDTTQGPTGPDEPTDDSNSGVDTSQEDDDDTPVSNVRADQLAVEITTEDDFELSVTTYESDLTPSTAIRTGTPSIAAAPLPIRADGFALTNRRFPPAQTESGLTPSEVQTAASTFENTTETVAAGYVQVEHTLGSNGMRRGTLSFSIRQAYLEELGVEPDSVKLYHQAANGTWTARNTAYVGSDQTHHRYEGTMPSFSVFALGTGAPTVELTDAQLQTTTVEPGEEASITASLENRGQVSAEETVNLTHNGTVVDSVTTTVPAEETRTVSMTYIPEEARSYALSVGSMDLTTLTVESTPEPTGAVSTDEPADDSDTQAMPGVIAVLLLLVTSLILGVIAWRRRQ